MIPGIRPVAIGAWKLWYTTTCVVVGLALDRSFEGFWNARST